MRSRKKEGTLKPTRKLDRKSSRGVMFENEGLRLRTIEINAEVDRGHSDLRKLKRENETLKHQVWTLRDEYDKLENLVKHGREDESDDEDDDAFSRKSQSPVEEQESGDDAAGSFSETDNLSDLKNVCSSQMRSFELTLDKEEQITGEVQSQYPHSSFIHPGAIPVPGTVQRSVSGDPELLLSPSVDMSVQPIPDPKPQISKPFITQADHFNLDQLLDFASSFHYDRRKHMTDDDASKITLPTLPKEEICPETVSTTNEEEKPASPSAFSAIRRRSSTVIEKLKRANSGAFVKEVKQVSLCKDGVNACAITSAEVPETNTLMYTRSYYFAGSLDGRSQSLGAGLNTAATVRTPVTPAAPLYSSSSSSNIASGTTSSLDAGLPLVSIFSHRATSSSVRLSSIEPNTLMLSVIEIPQLWDITTQEIIDELEGQISFLMHDIRGIRVTSHAAYISLGHRETLLRIMECGLTIRGYICPLIDISVESIIVILTGVPHYIADATLTILLSAFGTVIGEIERRYYKGVDTGERFVRIKLKSHVKLPKYVTVGGCRIVLTVHGHERHISRFADSPITAPLHPGPPFDLNCSSNKFQKEKGWNVDGCDDPKTEKHKDSKENLNKRSSFEGNPKKNPEHCGKHSKTFASRCIVNLKKPDRPSSTGSGKLPSTNTPPLTVPKGIVLGTSTPVTPNKKEHVFRAGSLERNTRLSLKPEVITSVPKLGQLSPSAPRRTCHLQESRLTDPSTSGPSMVIFEESSKNLYTVPHATSVPVISSYAPTLANGILRKCSISTPEQESLLPPQTHKVSAAIRNRLKIGRSPTYDSAKERILGAKSKKGNPVSKMESIRENTDVLGEGNPSKSSRSAARRDSDKSINSNGNKQKKEAIDLPWCGCWGNGCF